MDFQEARRYGDVLALSAFIIAQWPNRQGRDERRMIGHDAQVAVQGADEDEIHIFMEYGSIGCNDFQMEGLSCFCHRLFPFQCLSLFVCFFDIAYHVEGLFRHVVAFTGQDFLEAFDGFFQRHIAALLTGELFSDGERLAEETLYLTGTGNGQLIFFGQFVDAQDGDDILQVFVLLEDFLDGTGRVVMVIADDMGSRIRDVESRGSTAG